VEALVKADGGHGREALLGLFGDRRRDLVVGGLHHDVAVQIDNKPWRTPSARLPSIENAVCSSEIMQFEVL
jgi:hypothetical protein